MQGASVLPSVIWTFFNCCLQSYFKSWLGCRTDASGMPRFRLASGLVTQLFLLPAIFVLSVNKCESFCSDCVFNDWSWSFCCVFASYMVADLVSFRLSKIMKIHHITCIISAVVCFSIYPDSFPYYAMGVVSMEVGSAAFNVTLLGASEFVYIVIMSVSNLCSIIIFYVWASSTSTWGDILVHGSMFVPLVIIRQRGIYNRILLAN